MRSRNKVIEFLVIVALASLTVISNLPESPLRRALFAPTARVRNAIKS